MTRYTDRYTDRYSDRYTDRYTDRAPESVGLATCSQRVEGRGQRVEGRGYRYLAGLLQHAYRYLGDARVGDDVRARSFA